MLSHAVRALPLFCLCFLSLASIASAQPAITNVKVEAISHGTVAVRFEVSGLPGATNNWIEYGPSHLLGFRTAVWRTGSRSQYRSLAIGGLRPDTDYYFRVVAASANGAESATYYCPSADAGVGYVCDGPDAPPRFHTAPSPGERPVPPASPEVPEHPFPEINGETFTVSVDDERECLDLQEQLDAAAAADANGNHQVIIPAGAACYGEYVLPPKVGPGVVVVRPSTPLEELPPPGVRIDPSFRPLMATLSAPRNWRSPSRLWRIPLRTPPNPRCTAPCTEGWRLVGLEITHPRHSDIAARAARITSVSEWKPGHSLFTLDQPLQVDFGQSVAIAGIAGAPKLNGIRTVIPVSPSSFAVRVEPPAQGASGGTVTQAISLPIESCGPGPRPICKTGLPHGLTQPAEAAIEAIDGADVIAPAGNPWPWMATVELENAPAGYDGIWGTHRSFTGLRLVQGANPTPSGSCVGECGTVRVRRSVQIFGFQDAPELNGSHRYSVVSENELQLDSVASETPAAAGGYIAVDPNSFPRLIALESSARNIVLDRCWIHGRGFPTRLEGAVSLRSDDSALVDSVVSDVHSWRPIAPDGGSAAAGAHGYFAGAAIAVMLGDASRVEIRNNSFENCIGITIFAEQFRSTSHLTPSDIVIERNAFHNDERFRAGALESDGRYYATRHAIEFKRGRRILIANNLFDGNWADWTPIGPAIGLLTRGGGQTPNNHIQDVAIRGNVFRRVATAIQMSSTDDHIEEPSFPAARIAIENNYFESVDFYRMRSQPSGVALIAPPSNFGGQIIFADGSFEDVSVRHNTALDNRGRGPAFFWYRRGRSSGVAITDNVLTHNDDFRLGGLPRAIHVSGFESRIQGPPSAAFTYAFTQTPDPDPSSVFARNLVLPGVRDSSSPAAYDDASPKNNFTKADCEAFYAGFEEIECAGSGTPGETANQRFAAALPNGSTSIDSLGRGANIAELRESAGEIHGDSAVAQDRLLTINFRTDSDSTCFVDLSASADFSHFPAGVRRRRRAALCVV